MQIKQINRKLIAAISAASMLISSMAVPVCAENQTINGDGSTTIPLTATVSSSYTVTLPALLTAEIANATKSHATFANVTSDATVTVTGDVPSNTAFLFRSGPAAVTQHDPDTDALSTPGWVFQAYDNGFNPNAIYMDYDALDLNTYPGLETGISSMYDNSADITSCNSLSDLVDNSIAYSDYEEFLGAANATFSSTRVFMPAGSDNPGAEYPFWYDVRETRVGDSDARDAGGVDVRGDLGLQIRILDTNEVSDQSSVGDLDPNKSITSDIAITWATFTVPDKYMKSTP